MSFQKILLLGFVVILLGFVACGKHSHTEPEISINNSVILGQGLFINESPLKPYGESTLFINEGDTLQLSVTSALLKTPSYVWSPSDESQLKVVKDPAQEDIAWAIAVGDSGSLLKLKLTDVGNQAEKTIDVQIVKHWADPDFFQFIGSLGGHYYYLSVELMTWFEARDNCKLVGGYLATVNSAEENALLKRGKSRIENVWIGIRLVNENENLTDENGVPLKPKWSIKFWDNGEPLTYENFAAKPSEPGIFFEVYLHMDVNGRWETWHEQTYNYFLEME